MKNKAPWMETLVKALYGHLANREVEPKIVDVCICKVRKKIAVHGINTETAWGRDTF
jgi:DNA-binding response OmpR family regulator